jgi:nitrite reductase/ring-hydroxylating ferredoxin subunit
VSHSDDRTSTKHHEDAYHEPAEQPLERIRAINNVAQKPDPREHIPTLGFTEYWYPLIAVGRVPRRKPVLVKLLGRELCVFRGTNGIAAIDNHCAHRGAAISQGRCFYRGTVSCPYHGWTYDDQGQCVAVLSEGPDSTMPGHASVKSYPVREFKDIVFVWMGEGEPSDPTVDLPPELFDSQALVMNDVTIWHANWRPALENFNDNHVSYAHRNSIALLMIPWIKISYKGARPIITGGGVRLDTYDDGTPAKRPYKEWFEGVGGYWPQSEWRRRWAPLFRTRGLRWLKQLGTLSATFAESEGKVADDPEWGTGPHLPGMIRLSRGDNMYTRWCVPIDEHETRQFYITAFWPDRRANRLFTKKIRWPITFRFINHRNFGMQDAEFLANTRYDLIERFSPFDVETVAWRRFCILTARYGRHDKIPPAVIAAFNSRGGANARGPVSAAADGVVGGATKVGDTTRTTGTGNGHDPAGDVTHAVLDD